MSICEQWVVIPSIRSNVNALPPDNTIGVKGEREHGHLSAME
jgi:hypothetical protein